MIFRFREFRMLVIEIVLATDMSLHFQQIKTMKSLISMPDKSVDRLMRAFSGVHVAITPMVYCDHFCNRTPNVVTIAHNSAESATATCRFKYIALLA